jgi:hypothetical protein
MANLQCNLMTDFIKIMCKKFSPSYRTESNGYRYRSVNVLEEIVECIARIIRNSQMHILRRNIQNS